MLFVVGRLKGEDTDSHSCLHTEVDDGMMTIMMITMMTMMLTMMMMLMVMMMMEIKMVMNLKVLKTSEIVGRQLKDICFCFYCFT